MTLSRSLFLTLALSLLKSAAFASNKEAEAAALIEHAKQLSDIRAEGAPAFRLKVDFKIIKDDGSAMDGTYTERWVSKEQWRRETVLGDFRRIQIAAGKKLWLLDNSTDVPPQIGDIPSISDVGRLRPEGWKPRKDRKANETGMNCVENSAFPGEGWTLCFDKISRTLIAEISPLHVGAGGGSQVCLHSDYQKFGEYVVARSYECDEEKHPKLVARVAELVADPAQDSTLFVPPASAKESVHCLGLPTPPKAVYSPEPAPLRAFSGTTVVAVNVVVGTDGKPHDVKVTSVPNRGLDEAALAAVRQWRFKPATCDGEPMEVQIAVQIQFDRY